ncbi:MAG: rod shape-determining protein MreD [Parcubacteria group bacterium]|jgi:rod shape-determining protein MreD
MTKLMYKKFAIFALLFLLVILQVSALPLFFNARRIPDLVLLVVIFFTVKRGFPAAWKMALLGGFLLDLFSFFPVGVNVLSFVAVSLLINFLAQRFFVTQSNVKFFTLLALVLAGTIVNDVAVSVLMKIFLNVEKIASTGFPILSLELVGKMLSNTLLFVLIYWPLKKLENLKNIYPYGQQMVVRRPS